MSVARAVTAGILVILAACGGDDDDPQATGPAGTNGEGVAATDGPASPAAECLSSEADSSRTVTISVDDQVDGYGGIGSRVPSGLTAGTVRVVVEADGENADAVTVSLRTGDVAQEIAGVEPGANCGVDLELGAGDYVVTSDVNDGDAEFVVVP